MGLKELLEKFRLVDFQVSVKDVVNANQIGLVNKIENNYNINMPKEMAKEIIKLTIDEALEKKVKEMALERLSPISREIDLLPESTAISVVASTLATATIDIVADDGVKLTDEPTAVVYRNGKIFDDKN